MARWRKWLYTVHRGRYRIQYTAWHWGATCDELLPRSLLILNLFVFSFKFTVNRLRHRNCSWVDLSFTQGHLDTLSQIDKSMPRLSTETWQGSGLFHIPSQMLTRNLISAGWSRCCWRAWPMHHRWILPWPLWRLACYYGFPASVTVKWVFFGSKLWGDDQAFAKNHCPTSLYSAAWHSKFVRLLRLTQHLHFEVAASRFGEDAYWWLTGGLNVKRLYFVVSTQELAVRGSGQQAMRAQRAFLQMSLYDWWKLIGL